MTSTLPPVKGFDLPQVREVVRATDDTVAPPRAVSAERDEVPLGGTPTVAAPVAPAMPLFFGGTVPATFCGIFAHAATAPLYWQFLSRLYVATFESDRLRVLKEEALEIARIAWVQQAAQTEGAEAQVSVEFEEPEHLSLKVELAAARSAFEREMAMARYIMGRCQRTGWIHYEFQREFNAHAVHFTPTAARTLDTWLREARDEQPPLQGYLLNVRNMLQPMMLKERPHVAMLTARRALREFVRELMVLSQDIARSIDRVLQEAATPQAVLEEALDRYGRRVSANYHRIKTVENVHRVRAELLQRLDVVAQDECVIESGVAAWVEREGIESSRARETLQDALTDMRERLLFLPALLTDLDERNAKFSGAAWRQLIYLLHQDAQLEAKLEAALRALHASPKNDGLPLEVYRFRGLAHHSEEAEVGEVGTDAGLTEQLDPNDAGSVMTTAFLYRPPAPPVVTAREPVQAPVGPLSLESAERLAERLANALTPEHLDQIALAVLGDVPARPVRDVSITSEQDYFQTVVAVAWARRGEGSVGFERLSCRPSEDEMVCGDRDCPQCRHRVGPYVLPNGLLLRTSASRRAAAQSAESVRKTAAPQAGRATQFLPISHD